MRTPAYEPGDGAPWSTASALRLLLDLLHSHHPATAAHGERVGRQAAALASQLGLPADALRVIEVGGRFHDVGKLAIPAAVLQKADALSNEEWALMRRHPELGAYLLAAFGLPPSVIAAVHHHHERYDGTGYPGRLADHCIPFAARIIAVADAFDVMTTDRSYRAAMAPADAVAEIARLRGTQFDPTVVDALVTSWQSLLGPDSAATQRTGRERKRG